MPLWKRLTRILLALLTVGVVVAVVGLVALDWYLGSDTLKKQVQEQVSQRTGFDVVFTDELGVSVYPFLGLETGPMIVRQPDGYGDGDMASASSVIAKVSLFPLLDKVINFEIVSLENLELNIVKKADGVCNLDICSQAAKAEAEVEPISWQGFDFSSMSIKGLRLENGRLRYTDLATDSELLAENVRLRTGRLRLDEPADFGFEAELSWPDQEIQASVAWMGQLLASPELDWVSVPDSNLQISFSAPYMVSQGERSHFTASVALDSRDESLAFTKFKLGVPELLLTGSASGVGLLSKPEVFGDLAAAQFTVTQALNHYVNGLIPPKDPGIFQDGAFSLDFKVDESGVYISDFSAFCDKTKLTGSLSATNFDAPLFSFDLVGNSLDFDRYYRLFIVDDPFVLHDFGPEFLGWVQSKGSIKVDDVILASSQFNDFHLDVASGDGTSIFTIKKARLWDGNATGELMVNLRHEGGDKHPFGLSASLEVSDGAGSLMPLINSEARIFQGRGRVAYAIDMPETLFTKTTNIDEVLRYSSCEVQYELGSGVMLRGKNRGERKKTIFDKAQLSVKFSATGKKHPGGDYGYKTGISVRAESESEPYVFAAKMTGPVRVSYALDSIRLIKNQVGAQLSGKHLPPGETMLLVNADLSMDTKKQTLSAMNTMLEANAGTVVGDFTGHRIFEKDFTYSGPVRFDSDPRLVFGLLDVEIDETRDEEALRSFSGGFDLALMANEAVLSNLDLLFDDTHAKGKIRIEDFTTGHSTFDLHADQLDINRYRPPKKERIPGKCAWPKVPSVPLPLRTLSAADIDGDILVGDFRIFDISFKSLTGHVTMKDGKIELPDLVSDFYGGPMTGAFYGTATPIKLDCDMSLRAVKGNCGDFMVDIIKKQYVDGDGTMSFIIHTEGATDDEFIANMSGKADVLIENGSYRFSGEQNPPKGSKATDYIKNNRTGFDYAKAIFDVDKSIFMTENFEMESSYLSATGYGNFDLDKDTIDLNIDAEYVIVPTVIPIHIIECLHDPGVSIPSGEIIGNTVREVLGLPLRPFQYLRDLLF